MDWLGSAPGLLGGLGLFLLGMGMLTEGLEQAAGDALRRILERWTRTHLRGLLAGVLITALVQSSSAITVATIGFVNAGLLTLGQALWVIFGSNVGTSMTGWLVAVVGFKLQIHLFALPAIGLGMLLRLTGSRARRGAIGTALAGFGVLFEGLELLRGTFQAAGEGLQLAHLTVGGPLELLAFVGVGVLLTVLMQSSSAALAVTLTAAVGGVIGLPAAAAVVVGSNVGTTSTAVLAALGATSAARRVAAAHVVFNALTAVAALALLPALLGAIGLLRERVRLEDSPAVTLALFHTTFNVLGVLLMAPLSARLVRFLERRFVTPVEQESRPRHLDETLLAVPHLALRALGRELLRCDDLARRLALDALVPAPPARAALEERAAPLRALHLAVGDWVARLNQSRIPAELAPRLTDALQALQYQATLAELALDVADERERPPMDTPLAASLDAYLAACRRTVAGSDPAATDFEPGESEARLAEVDAGYRELKSQLLQAGAAGLPVRALESLLTRNNLARRACRQAHKGALALRAVSAPLDGEPQRAHPPEQAARRDGA